MKIKCKICQAEFDLISATHLKKHGMTPEDYLNLFPGAELISEQAKLKKAQNISKSKTGKPSWNKGMAMSDEFSKKISEAKKGRKSNRAYAPLSEEIKSKISKSLEGVSSTEEAKHKMRQVWNQRLEAGWVSPLKDRSLSEEHANKARAALEEARRIVNQKSISNLLERIDKENLVLDNVDGSMVTFTCKNCGDTFSVHRQLFYPSKRFTDICFTCNPRDSAISKEETELFEWLSATGVRIVRSDRTVLGGKELDMFLPDFNLAIEYNGLYWHSVKNTSLHRYHIDNKFRQALKSGVLLITIFSDEWNINKDIVKSRILNKIGMTPNKLYARQCLVKRIGKSEKNDFLSANHLQGADVAKIAYGAFFRDELVSVMTFKPTNFVKGGDGSVMELSRFASKINHNVVGIAQKILKAFDSHHKSPPLISYSDNRWGTGGLYKNLGMTMVGNTKPSYWYIAPGYTSRLHRSNFMKHKLKSFENYEENKTEVEIMLESGMDIIYDCGTTKWERK